MGKGTWMRWSSLAFARAGMMHIRRRIVGVLGMPGFCVRVLVAG